MRSIFISGSRSIVALPKSCKLILNDYIKENYSIYVGDAEGVDLIIQEYLFKNDYKDVTIAFIESKPRNNKLINVSLQRVEVGGLKGRAAQTTKDKYMTENSDESFVIWDGDSKGSCENILRALKLKKKVKIFYKDKLIPSELINEKFIEELYYENHYFSLSEYIESFKSLNIKSVQEANKILIDAYVQESKSLIKEKIVRGKKVKYYKKCLLDKYFLKEDCSLQLFSVNP